MAPTMLPTHGQPVFRLVRSHTVRLWYVDGCSMDGNMMLIRGDQLLCLVFEMTGALAVGARTASTIKNGIIPLAAFQGNAPVQLLAFTCAAAGASIWVMWCTRHNAHVSSTYSLVSSIAGVGVATVGVKGVQWGWNGTLTRRLF